MGNGDKCLNILTRNIGNQNPHELINSFRNSKQFRIAVTVDMIATGTDIKPLEVLIFMRDIKSASYYAQMVGRGMRSIYREDLRAVTPNADSKTHFYVIDAVGVSESQKLDSHPLERKKSLNFKEILNCVRESVEKDSYEKDVLLSFASRLSRLELKLGDDDNASLKDFGGKSLCPSRARFWNLQTQNVPNTRSFNLSSRLVKARFPAAKPKILCVMLSLPAKPKAPCVIPNLPFVILCLPLIIPSPHFAIPSPSLVILNLLFVILSL